MKKDPILLDPTQLENRILARRYAKHHGPYALTDGWEKDLDKIFPGCINLPYEQSEEVYGSLTPFDKEILHRICTWLEPKIIVEFGTYLGHSTKLLAESSPPETQVITVDLPEGYNLEKLPCSTDIPFAEVAQDKCGIAYQNSLAKDKIIQVRMDATTPEFERHLEEILNGEEIDLALVDAAHDYETTKYIFELAHRYTREGGVIFSDDYNKLVTHQGVTLHFLEKAIKEGYCFYFFSFRNEPEKTRSILFLNVPGAIKGKQEKEAA